MAAKLHYFDQECIPCCTKFALTPAMLTKENVTYYGNRRWILCNI